MKVKSLRRVRLLATPWTAADQAPPSMGFSRQEYWSGGAIAVVKNLVNHYTASEDAGSGFELRSLKLQKLCSFPRASHFFHLMVLST